jgi:hypothetical protein
MTVVFHPPYISVSPIYDKTDRPPIETTELMETESEAMQRIRLKRQKRSERCIRVEGNYFECDCGQYAQG